MPGAGARGGGEECIIATVGRRLFADRAPTSPQELFLRYAPKLNPKEAALIGLDVRAQPTWT